MPTIKDKQFFGCPHCTGHIETYPPDDDHPKGSVEKPKEAEVVGSIIERTYDCPNEDCHSPITIYWYMQKWDVSSG